MNDTDILARVVGLLKIYAQNAHPLTPSLSEAIVRSIERDRGDRRKAQDAPMGLCMICQQPFHGMQPCKTVKAIKPQAERDDWRKPQIQDTEHPHPYGAAYRQTHPALHTSECQRHNVGRLADGKYPSCVCAKDATPATSTHTRIGGVPIRTAGGPYLTAADVQWGEREKRMASDILNRAFAEPEQPQAFWRCKHYPSAIHNWWTAEQCEWGCHNHPPTWDSNGDSK